MMPAMRPALFVLALAACGDATPAIIDARIVDGATGDGGVGDDAAVIDGPVVSPDAPVVVADAAVVDGPVVSPDAPVVVADAAVADGPVVSPDAAAIDGPVVSPDAAAPDAPTVAPDAAVPEFFGPTPYLSPGDRPFTVAAAQFEDFEDGALNTLGVTASTFSIASSFGPGLIDSVDLDDGTLDGTCQPGCDDLWANGSVTFTFDAAALGGLPTHVGLVWTDGGPGSTVTLEAFDAAGTSLGTRAGTGFADGAFTGGTAEDRFFGVRWAGGVRQVRLSNTSGGIEVDHLYYGR
jgi:hypothetical protein